jgi:hypothetical protein
MMEDKASLVPIPINRVVGQFSLKQRDVSGVSRLRLDHVASPSFNCRFCTSGFIQVPDDGHVQRL